MQFTAIDFETANSDRASVCSVGLAFVHEGRLAGGFSQLIRPDPLLFEPFNESIHGISAADVRSAPTFVQFWPTLWSLVNGPLVAHNAAFDISVLRHALDQGAMSYPDTEYFCTRIIAKLVWPHHATFALDHVAQSLGIRFNHHDAQEDARACAEVALEACKSTGVSSLEGLSKVFGVRAGRLFDSGYFPFNAPRTAGSNGRRRNKLRAADFVAREVASPDGSACFGRTFVFTGELSSMERSQAMQAVVDRGGFCNDGVTKKCNFLVIGQVGYRGFQAGHKSSKMLRAEAIRSEGLPIEIISESDFVQMLCVEPRRSGRSA